MISKNEKEKVIRKNVKSKLNSNNHKTNFKFFKTFSVSIKYYFIFEIPSLLIQPFTIFQAAKQKNHKKC